MGYFADEPITKSIYFTTASIDIILNYFHFFLQLEQAHIQLRQGTRRFNKKGNLSRRGCFAYCYTYPQGKHKLCLESKNVLFTRGIKIADWEPSWCRPKDASKQHPHGSEPPVTQIGQPPWLRPGWTMLPVRTDFCPNTSQIKPTISGMRITTTT